VRRSVTFGAVVAFGAFGLTGCVPRTGDKVSAQIRTIEAEETPQKLLARGRAFASVGDNARAEEYFASALDHGAEPRVALPLLFRACAEERRYRAAIDYAEPHLKKHPDDFHLRFVIASFYATIGENGVARRELESVAKQSPDFAPAHFALGVLLRDEAGDVVSADAQFREYLRLEPRGAHADEARGSLLKLVDHGGAPITVPPVWRDIGSLSRPEDVKRSAP
jgi:tetratricopeptide (TPR) repeat protein